jgi:hypothetical protein
MATNLARQACPVLLDRGAHVALIDWVRRCVDASSATDAGDMKAVADVVATIATQPLLAVTADKVWAQR